MKQYRVKAIEFNNRRKVFNVTVSGRAGRNYMVPYGYAKVGGLIDEVWLDREVGNSAFEWRTRDGAVGGMLAEEVLYMHRDPEVRRNHLLHKLSVRADRLRRQRNISVGVLAEMAGMTQPRVSHLLKPNEYRNKTIDTMLKLLFALGDDLDAKWLEAVA